MAEFADNASRWWLESPPAVTIDARAEETMSPNSDRTTTSSLLAAPR
jgi:hypothetical protein